MILNNFIEAWRQIKPRLFTSGTTLIISFIIIAFFAVDTVWGFMW